MFRRRSFGPGLERLNEKVRFSQRSRTIGHHFEAIASRSVSSMRLLLSCFRMVVYQDCHFQDSHSRDAAPNSQNRPIKSAFDSESGFASLCGAIEANFVSILKNPCRAALRKEDLQ